MLTLRPIDEIQMLMQTANCDVRLLSQRSTIPMGKLERALRGVDCLGINSLYKCKKELEKIIVQNAQNAQASEAASPTDQAAATPAPDAGAAQ